MKIVFYSFQLCERGTETALIDYAYANKNILNNESILAFPSDRIFDMDRLNQLKNDFKIILFDDVVEFNQILKENKIDLLYIITHGEGEDISDQISGIKTFVHCVFSTRRKHGTYYCAIHPYLNKYFHTKYPVLPHIVKKLPDINQNLRSKLNIPINATVFGSYAGKDRFNIKFVQECIEKIAENNNDIYFLFMNINIFTSKKLKNIIFLPGSTDSSEKVRFINTCDAMIHARDDGETFGLSIAEFSSFNKPIITYKPSLFARLKYYYHSNFHKQLTYSEAHLMNLGKKAITYSNKKQLYNVLLNFNKYFSSTINYDCFTKNFSDFNVINIFNEIISGKN